MSTHDLRFIAGFAAAFACASACAHDGDLDPTFGTSGGFTVLDFGAIATAYGTAIAPDGRIAIGGVVEGGAATGTDFAAALLTRDGLPDPLFSVDGKTTVAVGDGAAYDGSFNAIVQSDGKIVIIGEGPDTDDPLDDSDFKLVRLRTDGTLDPTFSGDGKAYINFDLGGSNSDRALDAVQLPNGKLLVVGQVDVTDQGEDFGIVRLNADGSRDTSFNGDGRVTLHFDLDPVFLGEIPCGIAIDSAGNIIVAGSAEKDTASVHDFVVARLTPDGVLDPNFGGDGRVSVAFDLGGDLDDQALELIVAADDSIFVTGVVRDNGYDFAAARLLSDGTPDPGFGNNGRATVAFDLGGANDDTSYGAALQPDGKLVLTGFVPISATDADIALARLGTDGTLDPTFGFAGKTVIPLNLNGPLFDAAVRSQIQGNYLVFSGVTSLVEGVTSFLAGRVIIDTLFDHGFEDG